MVTSQSLLMSAKGERFSVRRVVVGAWLLLGLGALYYLLVQRSIGGAVSLTGAGVVAIINFCWHEQVIDRVVQPKTPMFDVKALVLMLARLVVLASLLVAMTLLEWVEGVAVAMGVSCVVISLLVEGTRWATTEGG